uniref:Ig-like domain-containing protein n=1 Tax=Sinocyclocheilus grahami TaxID=75366 RepID=A0A672L6Q0_SINGR
GDTDEVKSMSVMEGQSVTLLNDVAELHKDDEIEWRFNSTRIAKAKIPEYENDGRFRDRLKLDHQTGSLTITNTRTTDSGDYKLSIIAGNKEITKRFNSVSVMEGDSVTLKIDVTDKQGYDKIEWRFGEERIARIKGVNGTYYDEVWRFRGRLQLDHTGSLTIRNTTTEHTGVYHLSMKVGNEDIPKIYRVTVYDSVHYCGTAEVVIRLVISALMGVAAVAAIVVLVYDIKSRTGEKRTDINLRQRSIRY